MTASEALPFIAVEHRILTGPHDVGVEQRWLIEFADGSRGLVGQLAADLASDVSIRRRYVSDVRRTDALGVLAILPTLATGPDPDPLDQGAIPPWRMRADPDATSLATVLDRAPIQLEEFSATFCAVADAIHSVHMVGAVLRDLRPSQILFTSDGHTRFADVGLARVDVLSSHTASSLMLQGSAHAAPEQLYKTAIDQRSDVFSIGAMMYEALAGELPYPEGPAFLREQAPPPSLALVRGDVPTQLDALICACIAPDPDQRPGSVTEIAWILRGGGALVATGEDTTCQHCGVRLRLGQRLCVGCGRVAVRFEHAPENTRGWGIDLLSLSEDEKPLRWLMQFLQSVSLAPFFKPQFIIGSIHLYADDERAGRIRLPTRLFSHLREETAQSLHTKMQEQGLRTRMVPPTADRQAAVTLLTGLLATGGAAGLAAMLGVSVAWPLVPGLIGCVVLMALFNNRMTDKNNRGRFRLRKAPAALAASDPFVRRLSRLLAAAPPADVHDVIAQLALAVQRLVDHRAALLQGRGEVDALTEPLEPLVGALEREVQRIATISAEMGTLEEGTMVRQLSVAQARGDGAARQEEILAGLDRLRALEDQRAAAFHRLLEVKSLLQRTVSLGLGVQDADAQHERSIALALATMDG